MTFSIRSAVAALLAGAAFSTSALAVPVTGDPVLYWNELMLGTGYNPGQTRPAALLNAAIHGAVNAAYSNPDHTYVTGVANNGGNLRAAVAQAAHDILVNQYPGRTAEFDAALAASLAQVHSGAAKTNGIATGAAFAAATLALRANDGNNAVVPYTPSGLPGRWAPTPPGFVNPPVAPQQRYVTPFLIASQDQFRAAAPPAIDSAEYAAAFNEVKDIGGSTSLTRTAYQSDAALFWEKATGPGPWVRAAIDRAEAGGLSTLDNARLFARLTASIQDATVAVWDSKYEYDYWRPVTGIRAADLDGNPDTAQDAAWTPFIVTPPHPSYVSAHAGVSGTASVLLADAFGDSGSFCLAAAGLSRCWGGFTAAALDAANSRLWGGIHWRFDNENGLALGQQVAAYTLGVDTFGAVPEPTSWALMITGFTVIGLAARRRHRTVTA